MPLSAKRQPALAVKALGLVKEQLEREPGCRPDHNTMLEIVKVHLEASDLKVTFEC